MVDCMKKDIADMLRELSYVYDKDSVNSYVSLYIGGDRKDSFLRHREITIRKMLRGEEKENFDKSMVQIKDYLSEHKDFHGVLFVSARFGFFKEINLPVEFEKMLVVDSSPYIRPLARIHDEWEDFGIVVVSSDQAQLFSVVLGRSQDEKQLSKDIMQHHRMGGCSQARFQRLRRGAVHEFFKEVIEAAESFIDGQLVLAGPGVAKHEFYKILPKQLQKRVVDVVDVSFDDTRGLFDMAVDHVGSREQQTSSEVVKQLRAEVLRDGLVTYGVAEVLEAVRNGQVELLVVEKDFRVRGWICEHCQLVKVGSRSRCSSCGGVVSEVDVIEEILEFAYRTQAEVEFTDDPEIGLLGHVGAFLRYKN